ncbi:MAG: 16S rRNA (guanine(527)-N(7))-methyltransferase RsmG [Candidatus Dormibacteraeota bacterium]|nr:16S rRNA (guanine(527)-N(7))-methyltransferase RsmG [Candidatus Dormibacteraeota bacterium]
MPDPVTRYAQLLLDWNHAVNLTGARTREEVERHIQDAYRLLELPWEGIGRAVDIGSGGGLPAIPLALRLPGVEFSLLEANTRKCAFLQQVAITLEMANIRVLPGRAEELARRPELREQFDRAISRAVAQPPVLLELALPFVRTGGDLLAEVSELDPEALQGVARLLGGGAPRLRRGPTGRDGILEIDKVGPTPSRYPRRTGVPNRKPLA